MLKAEVAINLDNLQFANRQARGTEDAIKQHLVLKHLEAFTFYRFLLCF